jgi:N-acetylmuramic acid 6-phosphate etherase
LETATDSAWPSEQVNVLTRDLDLYPTETMIGLMHLQDQQAVAAVRPALPAITRAADDIASRMGQGGRLIYVGAGTSGRLGVLDASECPPTFNADSDQVVGVIAGGVAAMTSAVEGVEDDAEAGARALRDLAIGPLDSIVGITASGRTPYVQGALAEAGRRQALTIALTCNLPAPVAEAAQHVIAPLVGPEALAGSTRLKAGTAQKLILNMLSTAVMVRLGKTYGNLMVDLRPENVKLQARTRRIVAQACGLSEEEAANALRHSGGEVKVAIVTTLAGCSQAEARQRLVQAGGVVRKALTINS